MSDQYPMPHNEPSTYGHEGGDAQQSSYDQPSYASYPQPVSSTYSRRDDMRSPYDHPMIPSYGEWQQPSPAQHATNKPLIIILIIVIIITAMTATGLTVWALTRSDTTAAPSVEPTTQSTTPKDKSDTDATGDGRKNTTSQPETSTQSAPQTDTQSAPQTGTQSETSSNGDLSMNSLNNGDYQTAQEFIDSPEIQQQLQTTGSNVTLTATGPNSVTYVETLSTNTRPSYMSDKALDGLARIQAETFNRNILNGCTVRIILRYQNGETFYDHTFQRTNQ